MRLLNEYILVDQTGERETKTDAGLFIPESNGKEMGEYHVGTVKHVAETGTVDSTDAKQLKVGDKIVYKHFRNIEYQDMELILFKDIIGIL